MSAGAVAILREALTFCIAVMEATRYEFASDHRASLYACAKGYTALRQTPPDIPATTLAGHRGPIG